MNILMVLTSHDALGNTGKKTGFWLEEFAAPYYVLSDAGAAITLASPKGGQPPLDPTSDAPDAQSDDTRRFKGDAGARDALANTIKLSDVDLAAFDAVFYPGGHGPLWDLAEDPVNIHLIEYFAPRWQTHRRRVPRARNLSPHQSGRRQVAGIGPQCNRVHQYRGGCGGPDRCGAVPG